MCRRFVTLTACGFLCAATWVLRAQAPQTPIPTFRSGVDIVELDVAVLDRNHHPVAGLTAADFTLLERGTPQRIVAFSEVDVPAPGPARAAWMRDAPIDVVSNVETRRLVTIVMDDAYTKLEPDVMKRAKDIARAALDQLGPADLAAVVFTFQGRAQNFTADRAKLNAAVDSYVPKLAGASVPIPCMRELHSCDVRSLSTVATTLLTAPPGRKIVILISGGRRFAFGEVSDGSRNEAPELVEMFRNLHRANITLYAFDAHGLETRGPSAADQSPRSRDTTPNESLYSFAASTGGRAFADTNAPAGHVAEAFRESSAYYLIGFQSSDPARDGRFRKLTVKVNRPGLEVRTRNGYYAPRASAKVANVESMNGLPGGDLPLTATSAVFAVPGRPESEVIVVARLGAAAAGGTRKVALAATAIDLNGKPHGTTRQTAEITAAPGSAGPDLPIRLPLRPGQYIVRLSADSEGHSGTVSLDVEVPNAAKDPLTLSGLLLQRSPAAPVSERTVASLVPIVPTAARTFRPEDDVQVFLRVYQGGKHRVAPVRMLAKITNGEGNIVSRQESVIETPQFGEARTADYRIALPVAHLVPGEYLLEVEAQAGAPRLRRTARFSITTDR